ncbi:MAG TPA: right-handed parallel beta-helix repeat-containing protein, partial [Acidimicrobiales bacterium]|nr:right-handed parallel beta-helix repeat-containing protein [Acidimicrobiales bacterium]
MIAKAIVTGTLVVACVLVLSPAVCAARTSHSSKIPIYYASENGTGHLPCKQAASARECTITSALQADATLSPNTASVIKLRGGTYSAPGDSVINSSDLLGGDNDVTITSGPGTATLAPTTLSGGLGIVDFSANNKLTVTKLHINSDGVTFETGQAPVVSAGGANNTLSHVTFRGNQPYDLVIDPTSTMLNANNNILSGSYSVAGILCSGGIGTTIMNNTVTGPEFGSAVTTATRGIEITGLDKSGGGCQAAVTGNAVTGNTNSGSVGIYVGRFPFNQNAGNTTIMDNTVTDNATGIEAEGDPVGSTATWSIIGNTVTTANVAGIALISASGAVTVQVQSNTVSGVLTGTGMLLQGVQGQTIGGTNQSQGNSISD